MQEQTGSDPAPRHDADTRPAHWPRALPLFALLLVLTVTAALAYALQRIERHRLQRLTDESANEVRMALQSYMFARMGGIERAAQRLGSVPPEQRDALFAEEAPLTLRIPGMRALFWRDAGAVLLAQAAQPAFDGAAFTAAHGELLLAQAREALQRRTTGISGALAVDGQSLFVASMPLLRPDRSVAGVVQHLLQYRDLLQIPMDMTGGGHTVEVTDQGAVLVTRGESAATHVSGQSVARVFGRQWQVRVAPTPERLAIHGSRLPQAVIAAGVVVALLLALVLRYAGAARARAVQRALALEALRARDQQLARAVRDLEARNRDLQDFVSVASHDLKEPLRKVQMFGERVLGQLTTEQADIRDNVARMSHAAQRMRQLVDDLLSYSSASTHDIQFARVDLAEVVREVLLDLEGAISACGGEVVVRGLPVLDANATMMRQLFQNLIGNALKFRVPERAPRVEIDADPFRRTGADGNDAPWHRIRVRDNGIGFDEAQRERIFQPFKRLHTSEKFEGTGIGLSIVRRIAERHGGSVQASATPGAGACFTIELPAQPPAATTIPSAAG